MTTTPSRAVSRASRGALARGRTSASGRGGTAAAVARCTCNRCWKFDSVARSSMTNGFMIRDSARLSNSDEHLVAPSNGNLTAAGCCSAHFGLSRTIAEVC